MDREPCLLRVTEKEFATRKAAVDFQKRCEDLLTREGRDLILVFDDLRYVDSSFIAALLSVHHLFVERGLQLGLAGIEGRVETILDTAKVSSVIPAASDLTELRDRLGFADGTSAT